MKSLAAPHLDCLACLANALLHMRLVLSGGSLMLLQGGGQLPQLPCMGFPLLGERLLVLPGQGF